MFYRPLHLTLILTVVATSLLSGVPCFCAEMIPAQVVEPDDSDDAHECCAGFIAEETPEPDCPQCASGTCDEMATMTNDAEPIAPLLVAFEMPVFTLAHAYGPPLLPVALESPPDPRPLDATKVVLPSQDTYALNRVIRC